MNTKIIARKEMGAGEAMPVPTSVFSEGLCECMKERVTAWMSGRGVE